MSSALEVELESSFGGTRSLAAYRGRVVVVFWEDREHQSDNDALKDELGALVAAEPGLADAVIVLAVGDVSAYDFVPARTFVRTALATLSRVLGIEILLDWRAALARPPFSLVPGRSNVAVLDVRGDVIARVSGVLGPDARAEVIAKVRRLAGSIPPAASPPHRVDVNST